MAPSLFNESTTNAHDVEDYPEARYSFPGLYPEPPLGECPEPIAIIGMGSNLPGENNESPSQFWEMLCAARDGWCEVPESRFTLSSFLHPDKTRPGSLHVPGGFFLPSDPRSFDPTFFSISAAAAACMDPQQRKLLETIYTSFESAGQTLEGIAGSNTGVFIGAFKGWDYNLMLNRDSEYPLDYGYQASNTMLSNRINFVFDLKGPSFGLDTGCSSSVYALHLACNALRNGECEQAVVAGASLILSVDHHLEAAKVGFLSDTSRCHTFDESADGFARGEGIASIVVKKLSDAVRDGDPIRAVIRGTATNANGRTAGIARPSEDGQEKVIRKAYEMAKLDPRNTGYFECHGTGTPVGDPIEVRAIGRVFADLIRDAEDRNPLLIGSVKTNVGHTEPTAGLASILKVVLSFEHNSIPPTIGINKLNPKIDFEGAQVEVVRDNVPWPSNIPIKRASINSFGYGGANSHAILEATDSILPLVSGKRRGYKTRGMKDDKLALTNGHANGTNGVNGVNGVNGHSDDLNSDSLTGRPSITELKKRVATPQQRTYHFLPISAHSSESLKLNIEAFRPAADQYELKDLEYTLSTRRSHFHHRAFAVASTETLEESLSEAGITTGAKRAAAPTPCFVFTGQGAQWAGMGVELIRAFPATFGASIRRADEVLQSLPHGPSWKVEDALMDGEGINTPEFSQPLCTVVQIALVDLLSSLGIEPKTTIGHSSGEIAAAYAAGRISAKMAVAAAYYRGYATAQLKEEDKGAMAAVGMTPEAAQEVIDFVKMDDVLGIACYNSPESVTVSGSEEAIGRLVFNLSMRKIFCRRLMTGGNAYHSPMMKGCSELYESLLSAVEDNDEEGGIQREKCPMVSTVFGKVLGDDAVLGASYWRRNMEEPVMFAQGLPQVPAEIDSIVEISPHSALAGPIRQIQKANTERTPMLYMPSLVRSKPAEDSFLRLVGALWVAGAPVSLGALQEEGPENKGTFIADLPHYRWDYSKLFWHESRMSTEWRFRKHIRHDILGSRMPGSAASDTLFRNIITPKSLPWVEHHQVGKDTIYPAAGYFALAIEAATQCIELQQHTKASDIVGFTLRQVFITAPIRVKDDNSGTEIMVGFRPVALTGDNLSKTSFEFRVSSLLGETWTDNATGQITVEMRKRRHLPIVPAGETWKTVHSSDAFYSGCASVGLNYGPSFAQLKDIQTSAKTKGLSQATVPLNPAKDTLMQESRYALHPATMDMVLQLGFAGTSMNNGFLPVSVRELSVWRQAGTLPDSTAIAHAKTAVIGRRTMALQAQLSDAETGELLMDIKDLKLLSIEAGEQGDVLPEMPYSHEVFKPDIDMLTNEQAKTLFPPRMEDNDEHDLDLLNKFVLAILVDIVEQFPERPETVDKEADWHVEHYYNWMHMQLNGNATARFAPELIEAARAIPQEERAEFITRTAEQLKHLPEARIIFKLHKQMPALLRAETAGLPILLEDDDLTAVYESGICFRGAHASIAKLSDLLGHKNPGLNIIEIGAGTGGTTRTVLGALGKGTNRRYNEYTFTDVSSGFFPAAQETLVGHNVVYKTLDIERDAIEQGFEAASYDLVVASNVLHATRDLTKTLENVRSLMKPCGKLLLVESTTENLASGMIFGTLPGWWLGVEDDRKSCPFISVDEWENRTKAAGFNGVDICVHDRPTGFDLTSSMIISIPQEAPKTTELVIVSRKEPAPFVSDIEAALTEAGYTVRHALLSEELPDHANIVMAAELEGPLLEDITPEEFANLQKMTQSASCLWLTVGAEENPALYTTTGLLRSLRNETGNWKQRTLHLATNDVASFMKVVRSNTTETELKFDAEGIARIGRVISHEKLNEDVEQGNKIVEKSFGECDSLVLDIEHVGLFDTMYFRESRDVYNELADDMVEVEARAYGLNMKDVLSLLGRVDQQPCSEGAGIVTRVGKSVTHVKPGDRVAALSLKDFGTHMYAQSCLVQKIPDELSFEEMAATPIVFSTVYECLHNVARVEPGESVLIHSAAGGVGVAAIQLARHLGANPIFCTVSSQAKREFLMEHLGIPEHHIFSSRDTSFHDDIMKATNGRGVDVALNSTINEMMHETLRTLAPFGRHVEIAKVDVWGNAKLDLQVFQKGISYTHVDLLGMFYLLPQRIGRLFGEVMKLLRSRDLRPIRPIKSFQIHDIEKAMRYFMEGRHIGKVVLSIPEKATGKVRVLPDPTTRFNPNASYFLLGCLGGLGRSLIRHMYTHGARHFILLSRSATSVPESLQTACPHANFILIKGDAANMADIETAITHPTVASHPIRGVVHAPMVLRDGLFTNMTPTMLSEVLAPKILGARNLDRVFSGAAGHALDFFVCTSSLTGTLGAPVQSNYAAANVFLDALCSHRRTRGLPAVSVCLSRIAEVGYVAERRDLEKLQERSGMYALSEKDFLHAVERAIRGVDTPVLLTGLDPAKIRREHFADGGMWGEDARSSHLRAASLYATSAEGTAAAAGADQKGDLRKASREELLDAFVKKLAQILLIPEEQIVVSKTVAEYGMDSMVGAELRKWWFRTTGVEVGFLEMIGGGPIEGLCASVWDRIEREE